jgi:catechol 2,3-dioxygenase-like lactoylglutathione lyase family enzyme
MFFSPQINYYVTDVEISARFYRVLLDFTETFRTPRTGPPEHIELRLGDLTLGVASLDALRDVHGVNAGTGGPARAELVLWTADVDKAYSDLVTQGATALSPPHDFLDGTLRSAWVADPDGNPVQIVMKRKDSAGTEGA